MADRKHIVIVGAGFGGLRLARLLAKEDVRITVVDRHNYHLFQPLLYQVTTAICRRQKLPIRRVSFSKATKMWSFFSQKQRVLIKNAMFF